MRTLHLVPIVHSDPDLGEAATQIRLSREALYGPDRLARHEAVVAAFWARVEGRFGREDGATLKLYQDGMVEGGEIGRQVVEELAAKGSPNFACLSRLMAGGAELRKTEELALVKREYDLSLNLVRARSPMQKMWHLLHARFRRPGLLKQRDRFIAQQINTTLTSGEVGVLFIGAAHRVGGHLAADIQVVPFVALRLVQAYLKALKLPGGEEDLRRLAEELRV